MGTAASVTGTRWANMSAWREGAATLAGEYRGILVVNMDPAENAVYLTFDDGPDPVNTVRVLRTLKEYGVPATFFFTGENIRRFPGVVRQTHEAGFAIGLHGYGHANMQRLTADEIAAELNETNDLLERITGVRATHMRPPYGAVGPEEIAAIHAMGLTIYLWSLDTLDWAQTDADEITRNVEEYLRPGDIILMHAFSGQWRSAEALPRIIEFILEQGYEIRNLP
jgi:peptidoglycan/xylan/chitin deacetylase (PgdA/CDA1 family)